MDDREQIAAVLWAIDGAWTSGPREAMRSSLERCFTEDVVVRCGADLVAVASGREACIRSYEEFVSSAKVESFAASDLEIDVSGATAAASYRWNIDYELGGQTFHDSGRDLLVFTRTASGWLACWRAMFPAASVTAGQPLAAR